MGKFLAILVLGVALFFTGAWAMGIFDDATPKTIVGGGVQAAKTRAKDELGPDLYEPAKYQAIAPMKRKSQDPIVLYGAMNAFETEEVPSQVGGRVRFIGEQVDHSAVVAAGSAAFLAEPHYEARIETGPSKFAMFYRRLYEGDVVRQDQMLALIEPSEALGNVLKEMAKVNAAEAEHEAAVAAEKEGLIRKVRAEWQKNNGNAISAEDYGSAMLTYAKLKSEATQAREKINIATKDKYLADIKFRQHEISAVLPYKNYVIKSIQRPQGSFLKQLDPVVLTVQNIERLLAEAQIEEQYVSRLGRATRVTATIEPTILEAPLQEFPGHDAEVNAVAVSRDMKIISGGEDKVVYVWKPGVSSSERKLDHDSPVRVLACTTAKAKDNLCVVGCADGSIYLWNLDDKDDAQAKKPIEKAHGNDRAITSIAFSPNGQFFATGAADGSIRIWTTDDFKLKYPFEPDNGVAQCHEDAVTSLTFTPQCRLISASRDGSLRVWELHENGASPDGKPIVNRKGNVSQLGVTQDGQWMLYDQGHTLKWYSIEKKNYVYTLNQPANAMPFETLAQFSPDGTLLLTAGAPEGRMQLWRCPDADSRGFEVRQFATRDKSASVTAAAFSPDAGKGGEKSFAVSAAGQKIYLWSIPTEAEVKEHRVENVPLTLTTRTLDPSTRQTRIGFEVANTFSPRYPQGRFEAGRPVTIVID